MASDDPWHVQDLAPEIREAAQEAARRRGLSVRQWLESVIAESAAAAENLRRPKDDEATLIRPAAFASRPALAPAQEQSGVSLLEQRLAELSAQVERLSRAGTEPPTSDTPVSAAAAEELATGLRAVEERLAALAKTAPAASPDQKFVDLLHKINDRLDQIARKEDGRPEMKAPAAAAALLPQLAAETESPSPAPPTDDWAADLDRAVAEIIACQRALLGDSERPPAGAEALPAQVSPAPQAEPTGGPETKSGLSALEERLDRLSGELRILREPGGFADTIADLREELAEIGKAIAEAAPRRVLEALEAQVRALVARFDEMRAQGGDARALESVEQSLAELCESLRGMKPAETLAAIRDEVRALDRKIAQAGAGGVGAGSLSDLQRAVAELRSMAAHVATADALAALNAEVEALNARIDHLAAPSALDENLLATLDQRFQALSADINAHNAASAGPAAEDLVTLLEALSLKIDALEIGRESLPTLETIVAQLTRLAERIEAAGARLDQLDRLERSFAALLDRMDALRAEAIEAAARTARETLSEQSDRVEIADTEVSALRLHLDALAQSQQQNEQRTQDTLEAMQDTLERLVERLATIEAGLRTEELGAARPRPPAVAGSAQAEPLGPENRRAEPRPPVSERRPIDPTLPADYPIEPGEVRSRVGASEAAPASARPAPSPDPKADFIAAARRAAQAAAAASSAEGTPPQPAKGETSVLGSLARRITGRRPLLLFGIVLFAGGVFAHLLLNGPQLPGAAVIVDLLSQAKERIQRTAEPMSSDAQAVALASTNPAASRGAEASLAVSEAPSSPPPTTVAAAERPAEADLGRSAPAAAAGPAAPMPGPRPNEAQTATVSAVSPLTIASLMLPVGDITGSLGRATGLTSASPAASSAPGLGLVDPLAALPERLHSAAAAGDPSAEYEIGARFAEGRGVPYDLQEAARWFERAATRNFAPAQFRLGSMYEKGEGVKKNLDQARRLYRAAADAGHGKATHNLAVLYAEGIEGSKPDYGLAAHWFRKAAQQGVRDSQFNLGVLYARGLGVERNLAESYKWFALAAQQGDEEAAKKRDEVAARLDKSAIVAARLAVQTFTPTPQPEEAIVVKAPLGGWDAPVPQTDAARARPGASIARKAGS